MRKKFFSALLVLVFLALIFLWTAVLPLQAQSGLEISEKLSKVLENQSEIKSLLTEIKAELNKVKMRI